MSALFVMDPLDGLLGDIDATVGLMAATQALDVPVWVCEPEDLSIVDGRLLAQARRVLLQPRTPSGDHRWVVADPWYQEVGRDTLDVADEVTVVSLRIDPPVDARYLHTTYLLDLAIAAGVCVVNEPAGVRALHEKLVALRFPELCPRTLVTTSPNAVKSFVAEVGPSVVKPVDGFAGNDVWLLEPGPAVRALAESATHAGRRQVIVQEYLSDVAAGNKRLFLLDGEIVGTVLRRPSADDFRIGPPVAATEPDADDLRIAAALTPVLATHGIALAGVDVIAGRLIEVNVTCPGGMHKTDALLGTDLSGAVMRRLLTTSKCHTTERQSA